MTHLQELHDRVQAGEAKRFDPHFERAFYPITKSMNAVYLAQDAYDGSLDAAKAMYDGDKEWVIQSLVQRHGGVWVAHIWEVDSEGWHQDGMRKIEVWNECPARALLLGRLRALIDQAQENG